MPTPNVDDSEGTGAENQAVSSPKGQSIEAPLNTQEFQDLKKRLDLTERELKGLQSRQDKGDNRFKEFLDEYEKNVATGMSKTEAQSAAQTTLDSRSAEQKRNALIDKLLERELGTSSQPVTVTDEAAKVLQKAGVNANDPAIAKLVAENSDPVELAMKIGEHKSMLANKPTSSAADASPMGGKPPEGNPDVRALTDKYMKDMLAARGNKVLAKQIKKEAQAKGVPVDQVTFTVA